MKKQNSINQFPIFLSFIITLKNGERILQEQLKNISDKLSNLVSDYELVIVDNASSDNSIKLLKDFTSLEGLPNLQVYALTKNVDKDTAAWVGIENALGDFAVVYNPRDDDLSILPQMLEKAVTGSDVVFASNQLKQRETLGYRASSVLFNFMYKWFNDVHITKEAPDYRILSKRIINFILQYKQPEIVYRHISVSAGFNKSYVYYKYEPKEWQKKKLSESIERGIKLLVSTTRTPMRLVTLLSFFGASANMIYSIYVILVGFFATNVAPGWVSMSLQVSGMFLLISLVLMVLGEYILHMASLSNEGPQYHVGQEFTSQKMYRREKLNIEGMKLKIKQEK